MITRDFQKSGIYFIECKANGKIYIGSSCNLKRRESIHFSYLSKKKHPNIHMQSSYNKHGKENFSFRPVIFCSVDDLLYFEQLFIDGLNPDYNIHKIAGSPRGHKHSEITKQKMRDVWKSRTQEQKDAITKCYKKPFTHTEETKKKISKSQLNRVKSPSELESIGRFNANFSDDQVLEMRKMRDSGLKLKEIADIFKIHQANVSLIVRGKTYKWVK